MAYYDVNAAIDKPNFLNSFREGQQYGQQLRQQQQEQQDQNALRQLAPQIVAGDAAAYDQAAAINPEAATKYQGAGDAQLRRLKGSIDFMDSAKKSGNPQAVEAAWQQVRPYLARFGKEPPMTFAEAEPQMEAARARIAMLGPSAEQKNNVISPGGALVDQTGRVVYQAPFAPAKPPNAQFQVDQQGRGWWLSPGQPPVPADMPTEAAQGPTGGASTMLNEAIGSVTDPAAIQGSIKSLAQQFGAQVSSLGRTPEHNREVGGVPNSQHVRGTAGDVVVPAAQRQQFIQAARAQGFEAIDEGDHVHLELPPGGARQTAGINFGKPAPQPSVPSGYRVNPDGSMSAIPGGPAQIAIDARADAAAAKQAAEAAKADQKRQIDAARQAEAATASNNLVGAIDALMAHPGYSDLGTATGDLKINTPLIRNEAKDANAQLQNIGGQVALSTMARLKALSSQGATGFGALSAPELKLLQNAIATLQSEDISNAELTRSLTTIRNTVEKVSSWKPEASGNQLQNTSQVVDGPSGSPIRINSAADYDAVPSGALYIAPDGTQRRKR